MSRFDERAELVKAESDLAEAWNSGSMVDMSAAHLASDACRVALWERGECCGQPYIGDPSRCACAVVCCRRHVQLAQRGMGAESISVMREICEHSDKARDIEAAYRVAMDMGLSGVRLVDVALAVISEG